MFKKMLSAFGLTKAQREEVQREINLYEALKAHTDWKKRLMEYLDGRSDEVLHPHEICVDNRCALGKWIHGPGKARFGEQPLFLNLVEEHAKFHYQASKVVEAHQAGKAALALQILSQDFAEQSRKTVSSLSKLNAIVEGTEPEA
ncbi:MAG: CZB domain-containing protein [Sideroxyarcus sp.]|nr:CZB domain-containing protein [Sideroxyarcus sp.]